VLVVQGGHAASNIVVPAILATAVAMVCGITAARVLSRWKIFQAHPDADAAEPTIAAVDAEIAVEKVESRPLTRGGRAALAVFLAAIAWMLFALVWPANADALPAMLGAKWRHAVFWPDIGTGLRVLKAFSMLAVPFLLAFIPLLAALRGVKVYEQFCEGAKEAFDTAKRIIPFLVAMLVAISLLRHAGVVQAVTDSLRPALMAVGFPPDLLPLAAMRPLSGGASLGIFTDIVKTHGADSMLARMAATIYGSTETTFYVLAVYFGSIGIRKTRHAVAVGLTADIIATACAIAACKLLL
jgi:spore maturation protein B